MTSKDLFLHVCGVYVWGCGCVLCVGCVCEGVSVVCSVCGVYVWGCVYVCIVCGSGCGVRSVCVCLCGMCMHTTTQTRRSEDNWRERILSFTM